MRKNTASALALIILLFLTGCATKGIAYAPTATMSNKDASGIVEQLTMMQSSRWKPDHIKINENYILWNYGSVSERDPVGNISYHDVSERIYFNTILGVQLKSQEKFSRQSFVVEIIIGENNSIYAYHTQDINEAKRFIDAIESLRIAYKK